MQIKHIVLKITMNNCYNKYWIWFSRIEELTCRQKEMLLEKYKSPEKIWNLSESDLISFKELNKKCVDGILKKAYREGLDVYEKYIIKNNIKIITLNDNYYPQKLKNIYDKPILLYAKGNLKLLNSKSIAMVGCRNCSEYGKKIACKMAYDLAKENITIVSGLAKGIDKYSHIGALEAKGNTIAVLGHGLDMIYPYENHELAELIIKNNSLIVTEYVIGTKPSKLSFPARNRIVSGLSDGVVVVEAQEKSGSLITADFALEQGKEVFAVPGNIDNKNSKGTNELIKQGANLITNCSDILDNITCFYNK